MLRDALSYVLGSLLLAGIMTLIVLGRSLIQLPRQMIIITAALFRLLRSNKLQGIALEKVAHCQKDGCLNGETEEAVKAVKKDRDKTDEFFRRIALTPQEKLEDLLKEDE
jgi:hypothetical protein